MSQASPKVAAELTEFSHPLRRDYLPRPNINRHEAKAPKKLREDKSRVILIVDNGVAMVVLDK